MRLREWSRRKMITLWVIGLSLEVILVAAAVTARHRSIRSGERIAQRTLESATRISDSARDSILAAMADEHGLVIRTKGERITDVSLTRNESTHAKLLDRGLRRAGMTAAIASIILYSLVPLSLLVATLSWNRARRPNWRASDSNETLSGSFR